MEGSVEGRGKGQEGRSFPILLVAVILTPLCLQWCLSITCDFCLISFVLGLENRSVPA